MKLHAILVLVLSMPISAHAEDHVRNGRPCLSGVCVGDEISTLAHIKWAPAKTVMGDPITSYRISGTSLQQLEKKFAPSASAAIRAGLGEYIFGNRFDSVAIPKLAKLQGFCEFDPMGLWGKFQSESGHATLVIVNVEPSSDGARQSLKVTHIERTFPAEYTSAQLKELGQLLGQRYQSVKNGLPDPTVPTWQFSEFERSLDLWAPTRNHGVADTLKKFPGCGRSLKVD